MYRSVSYEDNPDAYDVNAAVEAEIGNDYDRRLAEICRRRFRGFRNFLWYLLEGRYEEKRIVAELKSVYGNYRRITRRYRFAKLCYRLRSLVVLAFRPQVWFRKDETGYAEPVDII